MVACRDWPSTLRRASYRGVAFFVEGDEITTGRRLVVHEFPHRDLPYIEDLGARAQIISVTAYVTGDDVEAKEQALRRACETGGGASLNLPMARFTAHCRSCRREYKRDQLGFIAFRLEFVREGTGSGPFAILGLARTIEFAATSLATSLLSAFTATYATLKMPSYVSEAGRNLVEAFALDFETATAGVIVEDADALAAVRQTVHELYRDADEMASVGAIGDVYTASSFLTQAEEALAAPVVGIVSGLFVDMRENMAAEEAAAFMLPWLSWGSVPTLGQGRYAQQLLDNAQSFITLVRASAIAQYAAAVTQRSYKDRREAVQAKADAAEYFEAQLADMIGWRDFDAWRELAAMRGQVAQHLHQLITTLAPVQIIEASARMPSLWWAQRLYGDAARAGELVERNGVIHASFMPSEFEALSR